jgi:hypothetical protein
MLFNAPNSAADCRRNMHVSLIRGSGDGLARMYCCNLISLHAALWINRTNSVQTQ